MYVTISRDLIDLRASRTAVTDAQGACAAIDTIKLITRRFSNALRLLRPREDAGKALRLLDLAT